MHTKGEAHEHPHSFIFSGWTGYRRDSSTGVDCGDSDVAVSQRPCVELPLALAELAFDAVVGRSMPLFSGDGSQLWGARRCVDMDLFDCRF